MKTITDIVMNPVCMRIIQFTISNKSITTTQLSEKLKDVPRTTLYRHVKELLDSKILLITEENKIRGQLERTLSPNMEWWNDYNKLESADDNFYQILMSLYGKFHNYFSKETNDPSRDRVFLKHMILMLSDSEMDSFIQEIDELFKRYDLPADNERKPRNFTLISSPDSTK